MGQIRVMTEALANQIAAGEVVERPASCVKELVENSLDAKAQSIYVAIEEGGIEGIVVQDDGSGMDPEDAELAFSRHATSKLLQAHDLFRVQTLGFRGEALASIAAVSRVDMLTRKRDAEHGVHVRGQGSELASTVGPVGLPAGTRIEVKDLFFNTPARLKYLRSVNTEQARCVEVVQRAALSRPDVAFRMDVSHHTVFRTTGGGRSLDVLAVLYGVGEAQQMIEVRAENTDYKVHGYIGRPTQGRAARTHAHLFINGRTVRNLVLHQAVVAGYGGRLMINRHPIYALSVEMDPTLVDVNIHPHKAEVRFSEERDVAKIVQDAVAKALGKTFLVPTVQFGTKERMESGGEQANLDIHARLQTFRTSPTSAEPAVRDRAVDYPRGAVPPRTGQPGNSTSSLSHASDRDVYRGNRDDIRKALETTLGTRPAPAEVESELASTLTGQPALPSVPRIDEADIPAAGDEQVLTSPRVHLEKLRLIGQALGVYVLADDGESLFVIDQHAAHERILYERFTARMETREIHRIALLAPIPISLSVTEQVLFESARSHLAELGLEFEDFGGRDVVLRTIPDIWEGLDAAALVGEIIHGLSRSALPDVRAQLREVVVLRACKAAVKANHRLSMMEMEALCEALPGLNDPFHCPHGRPVFVRLTNRELQKEFRRIV